MLLDQFAEALGTYINVLNQIVLDANHPEIASLDDVINWVARRQSELDAARQNVEQLASRELVAAVVPPEGTNGEQWTVQLLAMIAESYNAISYVFTSGPPRATSNDPRAVMSASVVSQQLDTASKLIRELDTRRRFLDTVAHARRTTDIPNFVSERAKAAVPVFSADEVAKWPPGLLNILLARGVLRPDENAKTVSCDACGHDHLEMVEFVQAPPGTDLRAYIVCPENGRVHVPLSRLSRWTVNREKLPVSDVQDSGVKAAGRNPTSGSRDGVPKRSWTQTDLDAAIRKYKAERAAGYNDIAEGVRNGRTAAKKSAQKLFGRNALANALGVKSKAMVTKSPEWQAIADELQLPRGKKVVQGLRRKVGLEVAVDQHASETSNSALDSVVRNETIRMIRASMPSTEAEATIEKVERGDMTDDEARQLIEVVAEQQQESRSRKTRSSP